MGEKDVSFHATSNDTVFKGTINQTNKGDYIADVTGTEPAVSERASSQANSIISSIIGGNASETVTNAAARALDGLSGGGKSAATAEFQKTVGAFVNDVSKGDNAKFGSYMSALAKISKNTNKFSKTIKKGEAAAKVDSADATATKAAAESASQEFLKEAKKAWKDIQGSANREERFFASEPEEISAEAFAEEKEDDVDHVAVWLNQGREQTATIGGNFGTYGRDGRITPRFGADAQFYLGLPLKLQTVEVLDSLGIVTPFGAIVFRPFQSFSMGSAVIMKAGNDTGFTCVGNSDFQLVFVV